ncbi:MAG: ABC transporter ATP-binding protein [Treponema sp.]|jgi:NitT/TauT family transport system ATP-binding protein|nr:ABC transporter ATP-binding protein [Treponema sp.]
MPSIEIRHISKRYPVLDTEQIHALEDINLTVRNGEFVCILGPSGCGKSTLLEIVAGLLPPSDGEILLDNQVQAGTNPAIGVVFQDAALFPWRNIRGNVGFGLELMGRSRAERKKKADAAIEMVGLAGMGDKYPHQLSGGMRQRAGLARTLAADPQVILMDEPFSAVDHLTRLSLQEEIIRIWQKQGKTIFFVTHDVGEAVYLATRVILLSSRPGKIQQIFEVPFAHPRDRNSQGLLTIVERIYMGINNPLASGDIEYNL